MNTKPPRLAGADARPGRRTPGIVCPVCGGRLSVSKTLPQPNRVRRRRVCHNCGMVLYTRERPENEGACRP